MASLDFITSSLNPRVDGNVFIACINLSEILGDVNGKINKATVEEIIKGLQITNAGTISIDTTNQVTSSDKWSDAIELEQYAGEMSSRGTEIYQALRVNDPGYVVFLSNTRSDLLITSPLILESYNLPPFLRNAIGAIYIELYALYLELLVLTPESTIKVINRTDLMILNNNIIWASNQLEALDDTPFELVRILRYCQRTILYIRSMSKLFIDTYYNMTQGLGGAIIE